MLQYVFRSKEELSNKLQTPIDLALALVLAIDHPYTTGLLLLYFGAGPLLFCFFKGNAIICGTFLYLFGFEKPSVNRGSCLFNYSCPVFSPPPFFFRGLCNPSSYSRLATYPYFYLIQRGSRTPFLHTDGLMSQSQRNYGANAPNTHDDSSYVAYLEAAGTRDPSNIYEGGAVKEFVVRVIMGVAFRVWGLYVLGREWRWW